MQGDPSSSLFEDPYVIHILGTLDTYDGFISITTAIQDVIKGLPAEDKRGIEVIVPFLEGEIEAQIQRLINNGLIQREYQFTTRHQPEIEVIKISTSGKSALTSIISSGVNYGSRKTTELLLSNVTSKLKNFIESDHNSVGHKDSDTPDNADHRANANFFTGQASEPVQTNDTLINNEAFKQVFNNLRKEIARCKNSVSASNELGANNPELRDSFVSFCDKFENELKYVVKEVDLAPDLEPVQNNSTIRKWFEERWPEAIDEFNEYFNKKALAEAAIPTGIVAAITIATGFVGTLAGFPPVISFGVGFGLGKVAANKKRSSTMIKDVEKEVEGRLKENDDV